MNKPNQAETDSQESGAQEIPQGSEVGDGEIIRIQCLPPHQAHNKVSHIEQDSHLRRGKTGPAVRQQEGNAQPPLAPSQNDMATAKVPELTGIAES